MNAHILKKPLISEKSMAAAANENVYTFSVSLTATKNQIKAAVEGLYGVEVVGVRTVTSQKELKRTGRKRLATLKPKQKKALVALKEGQTIALFDVPPAE